MFMAETRFFVIGQSTNGRWARRTLIGLNSAINNILFTLAITVVSEHFALADVCYYPMAKIVLHIDSRANSKIYSLED